MSVEGVLLSYTSVGHFGDDFSKKSTCVSSSGIKFCKKWVLTHGMFLSSMKSVQDILKTTNGKEKNRLYEDLPEICITSETDTNFTVSVGRIRFLWKCEIMTNIVNQLLRDWTIGTFEKWEQSDGTGKDYIPIFVLIEIPGFEDHNKNFNHKDVLLELLKLLSPHSPGRGERLYIDSTPFGNEVFLNSRTEGTVCNSIGNYNELLLTDASSSMCCEGGPVFNFNSKSLVGIVLSSLSWWRGEWVGFTVVGALRPILQNIIYPNKPINITTNLNSFPVAAVIDLIDLSIVLIKCGSGWGSGLILQNNYILTCSHVIPNINYDINVFICGEVHKAKLIYQSSENKAYDLALLKCETLKSGPEDILPFATEPPFKGEHVVAVGFPFFNDYHCKDIRPTISGGTINKIHPHMIQTSCCVQSGFSGGCILRIRRPENRGIVCEVLGIIVCNIKNDEKKVSFPNINMAVPVSAIKSSLDLYMKTKKLELLNGLEAGDPNIQSLWRLQASKL